MKKTELMSVSVQLDINCAWGMNQVVFELFKASPVPFEDKVHFLRDLRSCRDFFDVIGFKQQVIKDIFYWQIDLMDADAILSKYFGSTIWDHPEWELDYIERTSNGI
tara:strand:- start:366 stop:686 length:321 start_codon:yes stop_codon:yes gene_type:complete